MTKYISQVLFQVRQNDEIKQWFLTEEKALEGIVKNAPAKVEELASEMFRSIKQWSSAMGGTVSDTFNKIVDWMQTKVFDCLNPNFPPTKIGFFL